VTYLVDQLLSPFLLERRSIHRGLFSGGRPIEDGADGLRVIGFEKSDSSLD
jgi:hypothetical protein